VFLIATSCIKVGKNEEYSHHRSSLRRNIYQKECYSSLLIEKCLALIVTQERQKRRRQNPENQRLHRGKKVGPFFIILQLIRLFIWLIVQASFYEFDRSNKNLYKNNNFKFTKSDKN
jgi:hypothetical protein